MNVKSLITGNYENWTLGHIGQTNPIQTQNKPNLVRRFWTPKMNVSYCLTMNYEQSAMNCLTKTNPTCPAKPPAKQDQTQPVVSSVEPLVLRSLRRSRIRPCHACPERSRRACPEPCRRGQFDPPRLIIDRMKQYYLSRALFPLTSRPAGPYNGACSKISFLPETVERVWK